jgi:farnesyl diphosphate synthase
MSSATLIEQSRQRVERALAEQLPAPAILPARLHQAMRYAVLKGGKRVRPALVYAAGHSVGLAAQQLDAPACAVELIHAYSLIHDDLPAMDDDDLRRGRPTCHKAFDEATAILAGDALQCLAFRVLARADGAEPELRLRMVETLALAAGSRGMAGGQAMDLAAVGQDLDLAMLESMHIHKTGALIRASVILGALGRADLDQKLFERLDHFGKCVGLAFQIQDDILDVVGDTREIGKRQGADQALDKPTYVSLLGLEDARARAQSLFAEALSSLDPFGEHADPLRRIADMLLARRH